MSKLKVKTHFFNTFGQIYIDFNCQIHTGLLGYNKAGKLVARIGNNHDAERISNFDGELFRISNPMVN